MKNGKLKNQKSTGNPKKFDEINKYKKKQIQIQIQL